jgi:hypothetical protein
MYNDPKSTPKMARACAMLNIEPNTSNAVASSRRPRADAVVVDILVIIVSNQITTTTFCRTPLANTALLMISNSLLFPLEEVDVMKGAKCVTDGNEL